MTPIRVTRYRCDYCGRSWSKQQPVRAHEPHCYRNAERVPRVGELSNTLHEAAQWLPHPWHPGAGKMWDGERWVAVPGHRADWFGDYGTDGWPEVDGITLNLWPCEARPDALKKLLAEP